MLQGTHKATHTHTHTWRTRETHRETRMSTEAHNFHNDQVSSAHLFVPVQWHIGDGGDTTRSSGASARVETAPRFATGCIHVNVRVHQARKQQMRSGESEHARTTGCLAPLQLVTGGARLAEDLHHLGRGELMHTHNLSLADVHRRRKHLATRCHIHALRTQHQVVVGVRHTRAGVAHLLSRPIASSALSCFLFRSVFVST
jgi:hypothetical protein